jgi:hypothetical protein
MVDIPVDSILASSCMEDHIPTNVIASENSRKFAFEWHGSAVENTIACWDQVPRNNGVLIVTP